MVSYRKNCIKDFYMIPNRKLIYRECPGCKIGAFVRKDSAGKYCRSCRATQNKGKRFINMIGIRSGKLTSVKIANKKTKQFFWECICDCGNKIVVSGNNIRSGKTQSCGCILKTRNGESKSSSYRSWKAMIERCYNPNNNKYSLYGARGIKVCDSWLDSFNNFLDDMGARPLNCTLDRIDTNNNYEKDNCRWATQKQQAINRRNNYLITAFNETLPLICWAEKTGINWSTIRQRIKRNKWTPEQALSIPVKKKK